MGCSVAVNKSESTRFLEATLTRITDHSLYTVGRLQDLALSELELVCACFWVKSSDS